VCWLELIAEGPAALDGRIREVLPKEP